MPRKLENCPGRVTFELGLEDEFWNLICRRVFQTGEATWTKAERDANGNIFLERPVVQGWSQIYRLLHLKGDLQIFLSNELFYS